MHWDYIVIGAGSAGCAATYELVSAGKRVLLLEAGGSDSSARIKIPAAVWRIHSKHDWGYVSEPDPTRHGAKEEWHRGRVLGGTSSINGMVYVRGAAADFDRWNGLCGRNGGWSAQEVMPIFRHLENCDGAASSRGHEGPLYVRTVKRPHAITDAFVEAARAAGHPANEDYNGASQAGVGYLQFTQRRGFRWSAADAFVKPLRRRSNFKMLLCTTVEKIEVSGGRAVSVVFKHRGSRCQASAGDIIVSTGALNSPKLLMLSGIGDPEELERHQIKVAVDVPGVGRNLREHALVALGYRSQIPTYNLTGGLRQRLGIASKYLRFNEGPIAAAYEAAAFLMTEPDNLAPDTQVFFAPIGWGVVDGAAALTPYPAIKVCAIRSHSVSSGRVRLRSADPNDPPLIECRLFESEADVEALSLGIEEIRHIMGTNPIANLTAPEGATALHTDDGSALRDAVRREANPACHPIGTCRMGIDTGAVVGPDLRVRGMENLWVADASIMPDAISANINAPCMMIGSKLGRQLANGAGR